MFIRKYAISIHFFKYLYFVFLALYIMSVPYLNVDADISAYTCSHNWGMHALPSFDYFEILNVIVFIWNIFTVRLRR